MTEVRIEDPAEMNVLGLFLAAALRRNLAAGGGPCRLRGALAVDAEGMRATVRFGPEEAVVTRSAGGERAVVSGSLARLVDALVRPRLSAFLRVGVRGNRLFVLRALRYLSP